MVQGYTFILGIRYGQEKSKKFDEVKTVILSNMYVSDLNSQPLNKPPYFCQFLLHPWLILKYQNSSTCPNLEPLPSCSALITELFWVSGFLDCCPTDNEHQQCFAVEDDYSIESV